MNDIAMTNSIGGEFSSSGDEQAGRWSFVYDPSGQALSLDVLLSEKRLESKLNKSDVQQIITWLQAVYFKMPD